MKSGRSDDFRDDQRLWRDPGQGKLAWATTGRAGIGHRRVVQRAALASPATLQLCFIRALPLRVLAAAFCFGSLLLRRGLGLHKHSGLGQDAVDDGQG